MFLTQSSSVHTPVLLHFEVTILFLVYLSVFPIEHKLPEGRELVCLTGSSVPSALHRAWGDAATPTYL